MHRVIVIGLWVFFGNLVVDAQTVEIPVCQKSLITVMGSVRIEVVPDEVSFNVGVEVRDKNRELAIGTAEKKMRGLITAGLARGVEAKDVKTDTIRFIPVFKDSDESRRVDYYRATSSIAMSLRKLAEFDALIMDLRTAGVDSIRDIRFRSNAEIAKRNEARLQAVRAAREKAEAMAGALGQKIGRAFRIDEDRTFWLLSKYDRFSGMASNSSIGVDEPVEISGSLAAGVIPIVAEVLVSFELE